LASKKSNVNVCSWPILLQKSFEHLGEKLDSRSGVNTQQRFKRTGMPIRLFQISISQSPLGDFRNTIDPKRRRSTSARMSAIGRQSGLVLLSLSFSHFNPLRTGAIRLPPLD